jgi:hypothetical protein
MAGWNQLRLSALIGRKQEQLGADMNVSTSPTHDISEEFAPDQPSWARACVGFTVSTCLIIALPLMLASV